jgi:hypothetical protein
MILKLKKREEGISLVEVLIALALLGMIAAGFLMAIFTSMKASFIADERTTAESIARSQIEFVKEQDYIEATGIGGEVIYLEIIGIPDGYTVWSINRAEETVEDIVGIPWDSQNNIARGDDVGLQRIKLLIRHYGKDILTLEGYKVDENT